MSLRRHLILGVLFVSSSLFAGDRYFMITFGVQDKLNHFVTAHTFAAFVILDNEGKHETKVVSWLPASGKVCLVCPAEKGRNYPLDESLDEPTADGRSITAFGPYEIKPELYRRAAAQQAMLERGGLLYKAVDEPYRHQGIATNCEHAVSDVDTDEGFIYTGTAHGVRGTRHVTQHLQKWVIPTTENLDWVKTLLGLDKYPLKKGKL